MSGLLFYVPGTQVPENAFEVFTECGDADLVVPTMSTTGDDKGPGGPGLVIGNKGCNAYEPKRQEWIKSESGPYWIGFNKDQRPKPEDLERFPMLNGHKVRMGDGNYWLIPVARHYVDVQADNLLSWAIAFPQRRKFKDGHWTHKEVIARHRPLWDAVIRMDAMIERDLNGDEAAFDEVTIDDTSGLVINALATNYRVSAEIVSFLDLMDSSHVATVHHALTDGPSIPAIRAKKLAASGGLPSSLGVPAG